MKYAELQKIMSHSNREDWLIHGNRMFVYKDDVLFTIELTEINERLVLSHEESYPRVTAAFRYAGSLIEYWPLLQTYNRPYSELLPDPRLFFAQGEPREPFNPKRLEAVRAIFNKPDQHEAFDQAVTNIVFALEQGR
ncbi:hypothetical protein ISP17_19000 [Dyella ginsengisoli]|uniref:Uncharacterized protein n=1 Tax=Dyella ginsengisoli TaxID=363848 RepID=A0ABW8K0N1_9GAMM